jgi:hypothetical protein
MNRDSGPFFADVLLNCINDLVSEVRTKIIATKLIRSATTTAASYRAAQRAGRRARVPSKMCLVLEETDQYKAWLKRLEQKQSSRKLEPLHDAIVAANHIIATTFGTRNAASGRARTPSEPLHVPPSGMESCRTNANPLCSQAERNVVQPIGHFLK